MQSLFVFVTGFHMSIFHLQDILLITFIHTQHAITFLLEFTWAVSGRWNSFSRDHIFLTCTVLETDENVMGFKPFVGGAVWKQEQEQGTERRSITAVKQKAEVKLGPIALLHPSISASLTDTHTHTEAPEHTTDCMHTPLAGLTDSPSFC